MIVYTAWAKARYFQKANSFKSPKCWFWQLPRVWKNTPSAANIHARKELKGLHAVLWIFHCFATLLGFWVKCCTSQLTKAFVWLIWSPAVYFPPPPGYDCTPPSLWKLVPLHLELIHLNTLLAFHAKLFSQKPSLAISKPFPKGLLLASSTLKKLDPVC